MMRANWLKVDLHSHTWYSGDGFTAPRRLVERAREAGLDRIAVTDHGTIDGALEARALDPERVIVGEEIYCDCGTELIGLFLHERVPTGLSMEETAARIREQGGAIYAPHPFAYLRRIDERAERLLAIADIVEGFNSRAFYPKWNARALAGAELRGKPTAAGSDAHLPWEIGRAYTELPWFTNAAEFKVAITQALPVYSRTGSPFLHAATVGLHVLRRLIRRGHGTPLFQAVTPPQPLAE